MYDEKIETVLTALRRVIRATDLHSRDLVRKSGLTSPQLLLLQNLKRANAEMNVSELANRLSLSQATVTSILDRLEARGMVARCRSEKDRRRVLVSLLETGHEALHGAPEPLQESFVRQFGQLQEWEQSMIISGLQRIATMMDAEEVDAAPLLEVGAIDKGLEMARD